MPGYPVTLVDSSGFPVSLTGEDGVPAPLSDLVSGITADAIANPSDKIGRAAAAIARNVKDVRVPAPVLTMNSDPIITRAVGNAQQLYWFQPINARAIWGGAALDTYYAYSSSDHGSGGDGIRLWTAPHPFGPWTYYGKIYDDNTAGTQTETPFVVWDETRQRLNLYYSQAGVGIDAEIGVQSTLLAHSPNGVDTWTRYGLVMTGGAAAQRAGDGHTGYARVLRIGNDWYANSLFGGTSTGWLAFWWSDDGMAWVRYGPRRTKREEACPRPNTHMGLYQMFLWFGQPWALVGITGTGSSGEDASDGSVAVVRLSADLLRIAGPITEYLPELPWQTGDYRSSSLFVDVDGTAYVYWLTKDASTFSLGAGVLS